VIVAEAVVYALEMQRRQRANLRVGAEVVGVPPRKVDPMAPSTTLTAAELKRQRKMAKRAREQR